jgi:hypothetical protein
LPPDSCSECCAFLTRNTSHSTLPSARRQGDYKFVIVTVGVGQIGEGGILLHLFLTTRQNFTPAGQKPSWRSLSNAFSRVALTCQSIERQGSLAGLVRATEDFVDFTREAAFSSLKPGRSSAAPWMPSTTHRRWKTNRIFHVLFFSFFRCLHASPQHPGPASFLDGAILICSDMFNFVHMCSSVLLSDTLSDCIAMKVAPPAREGPSSR